MKTVIRHSHEVESGLKEMISVDAQFSLGLKKLRIVGVWDNAGKVGAGVRGSFHGGDCFSEAAKPHQRFKMFIPRSCIENHTIALFVSFTLIGKHKLHPGHS